MASDSATLARMPLESALILRLAGSSNCGGQPAVLGQETLADRNRP